MSKKHSDEYEIFGKRAASLREERNISQSQIGDILKIPQSTYAGYETGKRKVPLNIIKKVAAFFDVSIEYLLTEDDEREEFTTIAAHYEGEDWTDDELEYIEIVKNMLLEKRKRREEE